MQVMDGRLWQHLNGAAEWKQEKKLLLFILFHESEHLVNDLKHNQSYFKKTIPDI